MNDKVKWTKEVLFMGYKEIKKYCMHFVGGERIVSKNELMYVESYGRKVFFQLINNQYVAYRKLDEVERELSDHDFLRIHQSYLVNMRFINDIYGYQAYLTTGFSLPIPRARYRDVREVYLYWKNECTMYEWENIL